MSAGRVTDSSGKAYDGGVTGSLDIPQPAAGGPDGSTFLDPYHTPLTYQNVDSGEPGRDSRAVLPGVGAASDCDPASSSATTRRRAPRADHRADPAALGPERDARADVRSGRRDREPLLLPTDPRSRASSIRASFRTRPNRTRTCDTCASPKVVTRVSDLDEPADRRACGCRSTTRRCSRIRTGRSRTRACSRAPAASSPTSDADPGRTTTRVPDAHVHVAGHRPLRARHRGLDHRRGTRGRRARRDGSVHLVPTPPPPPSPAGTRRPGAKASRLDDRLRRDHRRSPPGERPVLEHPLACFLRFLGHFGSERQLVLGGGRRGSSTRARPCASSHAAARFNLCKSVFGTPGTSPDASVTRDAPILEAYKDHLVVGRFGFTGQLEQTTNRTIADDRNNPAHLALMACCFHNQATIKVRAGGEWLAVGQNGIGMLHHVIAQPSPDPTMKGAYSLASRAKLCSTRARSTFPGRLRTSARPRRAHRSRSTGTAFWPCETRCSLTSHGAGADR